MGRFASTASLYARARPPYGAAFFAAVARRLALTGFERLLDLGTGPGVLAVGFAPHVAEVIAVDPEPAMAAAAREAVAAAGAAVRVVEARAEDLPPGLGTFEVATIGRALHWMEPAPTRAALERLIAPRGAVLVCGARSRADGSNPWLSAHETLRRRWSDGATHPHGDYDRAIFSGTRFRSRETIAVRFAQTVPVALMADRILSMSSSSPERVGDRADVLRAEVTAALTPFARDGLLAEEIEAGGEIFRSVPT